MMHGSIQTKDNLVTLFHKNVNSGTEGIDYTDEHIHDDVNDMYELIHDNEYCMMGDEDLDLRLHSIKNKPSIILHYEMITSGLFPFIRYRLNNVNGILNFHVVDVKGNIPLKFKHEEYCGLFEFEDEQFLVFKRNKPHCVNEISKHQHEHWLISDDIVNHKKYFDMSVDERVSTFFTKNSSFLLAVNEHGNGAETPISGYKGDYYKKVGLMSKLGVMRADPNSSLGPYYYFNNYEKSVRCATLSPTGKPIVIRGTKITIGNSCVFTQGCVVKYALFLGKTKIFLNKSSDPKDESSIEKYKDMLKVRDTKGKWTNDYDSVIHPPFTKYEFNGVRKLEPQTILKTKEQYTTLEYAFYKTDQVAKNGFYNMNDVIIL
jgi:hypothetical protein